MIGKLTLSNFGPLPKYQAALKWDDLDEEKGSLLVTKTLYNPNNNINKYQLLTPKTSGSIRAIRIHERLIKMLKRHAEIKLQKGPLYR